MATMRSPNYPSDGLGEVLQMARRLWDKENRTAVSAEVAVKAMGYQTLNGTSRMRLSSVKKYGLIEDVPNDGVRISELGMRLLHHQPETDEYQEAIREAALRPELFKELYETHSKGSDDAIRSYLVLKRAFSESGARQAIETFRGTLLVAKLDGSGYTPPVHEQKPMREASPSPTLSGAIPPSRNPIVPTLHSPIPGSKAYSWALSGDVKASLNIDGEPEAEDLELLRDYVEITIKALKRKKSPTSINIQVGDKMNLSDGPE